MLSYTTISDHILCKILCSAITRCDSDSSWRWEELMLYVIWISDGRRCIGVRTIPRPPTQWWPLTGYIFWWSIEHHCLLVSDRYWFAKAEAANFTGSILCNFGWIVQPLIIVVFTWISRCLHVSFVCIFRIQDYNSIKITPPLPSNRHHLSSGVCLEGKAENYQVCSVQYCVQQLCTVRCTHIWTD